MSHHHGPARRKGFAGFRPVIPMDSLPTMPLTQPFRHTMVEENDGHQVGPCALGVCVSIKDALQLAVLPVQSYSI